MRNRPTGLIHLAFVPVLLGLNPAFMRDQAPRPATDISVAAQLPTGNMAHVWVDTNGGTCTRQSTAGAYVDAQACGSFAAATMAASSGDTIRVKTGTYASQSAGDNSKLLTFIGEDGAIVDSGSTHSNGLTFRGKVTLDNIDHAGDYPFVYIGGDGSTWKNSRFFAGRQTRLCSANDPEPILITAGSPALVTNVTLQNLVSEAQRGSANHTGGCTGANYPDGTYLLVQIRFDEIVNGVLIDRVQFQNCPNGAAWAGCGSGHVFITSTPTGSDPTNIVVRNSSFGGTPNYAVQVHGNVGACNFAWRYNTFLTGEPISFDGCGSNSMVFVGNLGARVQNCWSGVTFTKNVWQWSTGSPCGSDRRVNGINNGYDQLGISASTLKLQSGSRAINAGETSCPVTANGEDFEGGTRPNGGACDAGWDEFGVP